MLRREMPRWQALGILSKAAMGPVDVSALTQARPCRSLGA